MRQVYNWNLPLIISIIYLLISQFYYYRCLLEKSTDEKAKKIAIEKENQENFEDFEPITNANVCVFSYLF